MAESTLQDRLRDHAKAFDGLLSLIPAKYYYGEDTSDQWKKKKQTKEEAAAARRAKLDPASAKSAKDVMDERARKRKLEEYDGSDIEGVEKELPKQGLKEADKTNKKQKKDAKKPSETSADVPEDENDASKAAKLEKRQQQQLRKKEKAAKKVEKQKAKKDKVASQKVDLGEEAETNKDSQKATNEAASNAKADPDLVADPEEMANIEMEGIADEDVVVRSTKSPSPAPSPTFDNPADPSANTSTSSVVPPATAPKHIKMPTDPELLKSRLAARIEALRAARKADGPNGAPARNRQELMEARRKKEEQRRAHKKELRLKSKIEEEARREEALASARDSPASSMMSPMIHNGSENNFSFGRVAFDGQQLNDDLSHFMTEPKRKGPQDPASALQAAERKRLRIAGLDDEKRADIEEKDAWLNAKKRAHGEKVRDETSLLKKTLKRKEKAKKKSEKEWSERKEGVAKGQAMKQKKREENLRKRKDEKGSKGKGKGKPGAKKGKPKSRAGFEGSFSSGGKRK